MNNKSSNNNQSHKTVNALVKSFQSLQTRYDRHVLLNAHSLGINFFELYNKKEIK